MYESFEMTPKNYFYDDIYNALDTKRIQKIGNPSGWDETTYRGTTWYLKKILKIGKGSLSKDNGLLVDVPEGSEVMWVRILNDSWFRVGITP